MKLGEKVFYVCNNKPCIGTIGHKYDKDKWIIIPLQKSKERVIREKDYIVPAEEFKKHLDICKKI